VLAVGIGAKVIGGKETETECVRIYVQSKLPRDRVGSADLLPGKEALGVETDVIEIGRLGQLGVMRHRGHHENEVEPGFAIRLNTPAPNVNTQATGTLGAIVHNGDRRFILSCNHILAVNGRALGAKIVPGKLSAKDPKVKWIADFSKTDSFRSCPIRTTTWTVLLHN